MAKQKLDRVNSLALLSTLRRGLALLERTSIECGAPREFIDHLDDAVVDVELALIFLKSAIYDARI